ncbi:hypothetical protein ACFYXH_40735 [Streptomyces sp. NPDC002730]|uniref:hypothetical protein n=1 Tax=Streptomyces sp. NPDC002730 TaxID=3364662 RepID=UPI003674F3FD
MSAPATRRPRRPLTGGAAPESIDWAEVGRGSVRRRARGMTHAEAAATLEDARFQDQQDARREDLANDERGPAELAEWKRIAQLLAGTADVYDLDGDVVVQAERVAEALEAEQRRLQHLAERAHEIERLVQEEKLAGTEPREGDEAARNEWRAAADGRRRLPWTGGSRTPWLRTSATAPTRPPAPRRPTCCRTR